MSDAKVTREHREAAMRMMGYDAFDVFPDRLSAEEVHWFDTGEYGYNELLCRGEHNARHVALAEQRGAAAAVSRLRAVAADLRRLSLEKRGKRELESQEHGRFAEALTSLADELSGEHVAGEGEGG